MDKAALLKSIKDGKTKEIDSLQKIVNDLKSLHFRSTDIKEFSFKKSDVSDDDKIKDFVEELVKQGKISNQKKWIYVFCGTDLPALLKKFKNKREESTEKFAQAKDSTGKSHCIYVGSSNKLAKRIEEHLGRVSDSTYAIRFSEWLSGGDEITCFCFEVKTESQDVLQNLENGIWNKLCPIIGKKGGK